ncbi:hypothetical protein SeMB42_g07592 [Synchytrium endobioticum]|uniref:cAMP-dependent protein kinase n=1 Tax=Synchytrium endobioticum TaxID=286115 RepID=A0A507BZW6_9FUNG|nr:hypothetical protein SeMB42_g07592 [Synchytrium endobioticum]
MLCSMYALADSLLILTLFLPIFTSKASIALYRLSSRLSFSTHLALSRTYCPSPKPTEISFDFQLICPLQANSHLDIMPLVQISRNSAKSNSIGSSAKDPTTTAADAASPKLHTESAHRTVDSSNGLPAQAPASAPRHDAATSPTAPSPTLASPDVVSSCLKPHKYELTEFNVDRTLGTGSFGRVHMVKLNTTGKYYAMKVLRKVDVVRMKQVEHTVSEKTILEQLDFPFLRFEKYTQQSSKIETPVRIPAELDMTPYSTKSIRETYGKNLHPTLSVVTPLSPSLPMQVKKYDPER